MPVTMETGRVPPSWAGRDFRSHSTSSNGHAATEPIRIALVNNMPDSALEDTELQFCELLESASTDFPILLQLFSLPELARGERGKQHLAKFYSPASDLQNLRFDGAIVTGTEPIQPDLRDEPYWKSLGAVLDWAAGNTASTVLSCLAAHAGVLYADGIPRNRLGDKQFGVFDHRRANDHELTRGVPDVIRIPHSRWNEVREDALIARGYTVLTKASDAGVDLFVKNRGRSLFVHFQGHPEYGPLTLLKEYRRDIRRFLKQERETYPSMPEGYFSAGATQVLNEFRERVVEDRDAERMSEFPEAAVLDSLEQTWKSSASGIYRNWLHYIAAHRSAAQPGAVVHSHRE
jgi:homoserine O-succinyltransferase/O-acetyltransferase